ncbi:MAG: small-conductance mechanosensitive channel [Halocynthiibacter sp.]|jgi:potassium efflux system protein
MRAFCSRYLLILALLLGGAIGFCAPLTIGATSLYAQTAAENGPNYKEWNALAKRAESDLAEARASSGAFEALRAELATWREGFLAAQSINQTRIDTLAEQISSLGPLPAEGQSEASEIAQRRKELAAQMNTLTAPRATAVEAYSRADGLIREIDTLLRTRQTNELLQLGPSPLNPVEWPGALADMRDTGLGLYNEGKSALASQSQRAEARENLPVTLFFLAVALVLLVRGRMWMEQLTLMVQSRAGDNPATRALSGFFASLGQLIVPVFGLIALTSALNSTGLLGFRGQIIADGLILLGIAVFGARWLAGRLFPRMQIHPDPILDFVPEKAAEARAYSTALGFLFGLVAPLNIIFAYELYSETTRAILSFPLLAIAGLILFRFGQLLRSLLRNSDSGQSSHYLRDSVIGFAGRAAMIVGIGAPILAGIGYYSAAQGILWPTIRSLALVGLLIVISRLLTDVYALITRKDEKTAREELVPVLMSFALVIAALPVFALTLGARVADLTELWARFRSGVRIGEVQISPTNFLTFAFVFAIGYLITRVVQRTLRSSVLPKTRLDLGGQNAVRVGLGYVGIFLSALLAVTTAGIDLSSFAIVAGALSVGIGFGLQNIVSNFVSGIILLIERPISEGDWIEVGGQMGFVRDISVRATRIETFDRTDVIVPNADLISGQVTNYTRGNSVGRVTIRVGVAYGTDTRRVESILREIAEAHSMVSLNPAPQVLFFGFGADSLDFEIRAILPDVKLIMHVQSDLNHAIAARFAEEKIEIPFAQRDIWLRNPEALHPAQSSAQAAAPKAGIKVTSKPRKSAAKTDKPSDPKV